MPPSEPPRASRSKRRKPPRQAPSSTARQNAAFGSRPARPLPKPPRPPRQPPSSTARQGAAFGSRPARPLPKPPASRPPTTARPLAANPPSGIRAGKPVRTAAQKRDVRQAAQREARTAAREAQQTVARARRAAALSGGDFDPSAAATTRTTPGPKPLSPTLPKRLTPATLNEQPTAQDRAAERTSKRIGQKITLDPVDKHYYKQIKRSGLPDRYVPADPFTGRTDRKFLLSGKAFSQVEQASIQAPALKVLDQLTRPLHAASAAEVAAIKGKNVGRAAKRGLQLKDRALGSDVLKAAGVKNKAVRGVAGFGLDVAQDPLTWITAGTGSVAEKAAATAVRQTTRKAGVRLAANAAEQTARKTQAKIIRDAEKQALRRGAKPKQARKAAKQAGEQHIEDARNTATARFTAGPARRAAEAAPAGRGATVKVAGREIPGVRRATAKVARGGRKATRKVAGRNVSESVPSLTRSIVREVAPRVSPSSALRDEHTIARAQTRAARSTVSHGAERADIFERTLKEQVPKQADRDLIVAALESGNISHVMGPAYKRALKQTKGDRRKALEVAKAADPKDFAHRRSLAKVAESLRSEFGTVHRRALRAGAHEKTRPGEYLAPRDVKDLQNTIVKEQAHRADVIGRLAARETHAREQAVLTKQAATLRHAGRTAVQRQQDITRARGQVARATRAWRQELAKPVTQRRGVPVLEVKVAQARRAWEHARRPATARVAETPRVVGPREGQAAERLSSRSADSTLAEQRLAAAHSVPVQKVGESHETYLKRVRDHAANHGLSRVQNKAERLLAKKPAERARGYFPHETAARASTGARGFVERATGVSQEARTGQARTVKKTTAGQRRVRNVPIPAANVQRAEKGLDPFTRDPVVVGNHLREAARATSQGEFAQNMTKAVGRPVTKTADLGVDEDLYKLGFENGKFGLHKVGNGKVPIQRAVKLGEGVVAPVAEHVIRSGPNKGKVIRAPALTARRVTKTGTGGQYVAMPKDFFEMMQKSTQGTATDNPLLMVLDRAQTGWKKAAITSLAFQIRNMIGDIQAGYYAPGIGGSLGKIPQATRAVARHSELARNLRAPATHATVKVAGKHMPLDEFLKGAMDNGVLDSGVIAHDVLQDTASGLKRIRAKGATTAPGRVARRGGRAVNRWITNRENVMRLATYKSGLDRGLLPHEAADMANLFHIDYSELSKSERAFFRRAMPFYCVPADHEILTRRGFKLHHELEVGEDVMSLNHETGELEWAPLIDVATFDYDGPLKTLKRRGGFFAFTDDHRWPIQTDGGKRLIKRTHELNRSDRIPLTGEFRGEESVLTPRMAAILGWLVGDGYFRWRGNCCEMVVYQSPKKHLAEIGDLLGTRQRPPHPDTGVVCVPVARQDVEILTAAGFKTKDDLLQLVSGLSRGAAEAMWDALFKAEGFTDHRSEQQGILQADGPVLEAFQMLCLMTGRSCNLGPPRMVGHLGTRPVRSAYVRKATHLQVGELGEEHYTGTIWCPKTKHGTWVMRHDGAVVMTGNTWTARSLPVAGLTMIQRPGKFANLEALREETGAALTGQTEEEQRAGMPASVKRQVPFVIRVAGSNYGVSASLPLTLLNEFPGGTGKKDLAAWMDELSHFGAGMVGPYGGIKPAAERLVFNRSAFTRQDIHDTRHPLVPAPAWISKAPDWVKNMTGATLIVDRNNKTGPKIWGWKGTADWTSRQVSLGVLQQASSAAAGSRPGAEKLPTAAAIASPAVGVRIDKLGGVSATRAESQRLRDQRSKLEERQAILNAQGVTADNATPEYKILLKRIRDINHQLDPSTRPKGRKRKGPLPLGGGSGGGKLPLGGSSTSGKLPLG